MNKQQLEKQKRILTNIINKLKENNLIGHYDTNDLDHGSPTFKHHELYKSISSKLFTIEQELTEIETEELFFN